MTVNQRHCSKFYLKCLSNTRILQRHCCCSHLFLKWTYQRQFLVITIGRKVRATEMSCWAVKRIAKNQIPCQNEENSVDDLVIADVDEQSIVQTPFLAFVPGEQIAEVTVQARTKWKIKRHKKRKKALKKREKNYTKNQKVKGNRKSGRS